MITFSPMAVGVVCGPRVNSDPKVQEFLAQYIGQRQPRCYLQSSALQRGLHSSDQVPLGHAKGDVSYPRNLLRYPIPSVYQDGDRAHALRPKGIQDRPTYARGINDKPRALQVRADRGTGQQEDYMLDNLG
jgi:hypothetical protein